MAATASESGVADAGPETTNDTAFSGLEQAEQFWKSLLGWSSDDYEDDMQVMQAVRMIGGGVIGIAVIVIVVNEVLTTNAVNDTTGPFSGVIDSLETTGVSAMVLLVVGLLVAAASRLMGFFGGGF
jgi:hypothetical protein